MRLIESNMLNAVHNKANWSKDNTEVTYVTEVNSSAIYLHGHRIATYVHYTGTMVPNANTFSQWPTATTRSRLRALGINASVKSGQAMINGELL